MLVAGINMHILDIRRLLSTATTQYLYVPVQEEKVKSTVINLSNNLREDSIFDLRPEKLSGDDFIQLTKRIDYGDISN